MNANASNEGGVRGKTPLHLWIVGILALLWNLVGAYETIWLPSSSSSPT